MSPSAADTLLTGAEPKTPEKNLETNTLWIFWLVAVAILKQPSATKAGSILHLLPQISLTGPQQDGPKANPRTYSETDAIASSSETLKVRAIYGVAGEMLDEARLPATARSAS
jgi:hypothetical protein